jgi:hypothetical protein
MKKTYISVDVEASGRTPGRFSMLSIGACVVGDHTKTFYRELKPLNLRYTENAMRIACEGLKALQAAKTPELDPKSDKFNPVSVLKVLSMKGEEPKIVMEDFAKWVISNTKWRIPVLAAAPIVFDGMYVMWYFDNFYPGENPFGHSGEDINSFIRGISKDLHVSLKSLGVQNTHNALQDAVDQAKSLEMFLALVPDEKK